jgi:hypothetical protein
LIFSAAFGAQCLKHYACELRLPKADHVHASATCGIPAQLGNGAVVAATTQRGESPAADAESRTAALGIGTTTNINCNA